MACPDQPQLRHFRRRGKQVARAFLPGADKSRSVGFSPGKPLSSPLINTNASQPEKVRLRSCGPSFFPATEGHRISRNKVTSIASHMPDTRVKTVARAFLTRGTKVGLRCQTDFNSVNNAMFLEVWAGQECPGYLFVLGVIPARRHCKTVAWASARASCAHHQLQNTAFFKRRKSG